MPFSPDLRGKLMQAVFAKGTYTGASAFYVGLFNGDPTTTGKEITGGGYTRLPVDLTVAGTNATNSNKVLWEPATTDWGNVNYAAVFDAVTAGDMIATAVLSQPLTILTDTSARISPGSLTIDMPAS
jgi:hypothetical protein